MGHSVKPGSSGRLNPKIGKARRFVNVISDRSARLR
jgi:hypothetical protein